MSKRKNKLKRRANTQHKGKQQPKNVVSVPTNGLAAENQKKINNTPIKSTTTPAANDSWEVEIDCVEACSKAPENITVWFLPLAKRKVDALMNEYKNIEWLAYLLGKKGEMDVEDIFVPDQSISTARVDEVECSEYNNLSVIGVIHSHHGMGTGFSGTDNDWINQNHNISLCIAHSGIDGQFRYKTPCGAFKIIPVNVRLKVNLDFNDSEFIESVKDKLVKKTFTTTYYNNEYYPSYNRQNNWYDSQEWDSKQRKWVPKGETLKDDDKINAFLSDEERAELEAEVEELDFTKELTLAEEMELLDSIDNEENQATQ